MTDSTYNGMFRVSPAKRKFYNAKNKELTEHGFHEKCKYDMHNSAIYDMDGNFIEEGKQIEYNSCFLVMILNIKIIDVKGFFNYHFDYTPDKEPFLDYLEFGILNHKGLDKGTRDFFQKLIDEKRMELKEHTTKLKDNIIQFYKDDLIKNFSEWKQKLNNPLATELQFLEIEKTKCENTINKAKELNVKLYHGEPSHLLYKETNELTKLKIINERIIELSEPQQSNTLPLNTDKNESKEPENKYPKIFKNGYAYQMFIELKNLTVDKNHLADYGFIYYKLFDKKVGAINDNITHPKFINFLVKEFNADIVAKKFTFKNQQNKQQAYNTTLEKYKDNIID